MPNPLDRDARGRGLLDQAAEAAEVAREAFSAGNPVVGIAATKLAAQLIQLARIQERMNG